MRRRMASAVLTSPRKLVQDLTATLSAATGANLQVGLQLGERSASPSSVQVLHRDGGVWLHGQLIRVVGPCRRTNCNASD